MSDFELKICFGTSKSKNYKKAMELARSFSNFTEGEPNTIVINQEKFVEDYKKIYNLLSYIDKWSATRIYFNGEELTSLRQFQNRLSGLSCYADYDKAVIQEIYCWENKDMPGWGCKNLQAIQRHYCPMVRLYRGEMYWFEIGHFITDNIWRIDKKEIIRLLKREAELKYLNLCPIFDFDKVVAAVNELPDEIDLSTGDQWEAEYSDEPGSERKPIKISPKTQPL